MRLVFKRKRGGGAVLFRVRCLPPDFPEYEFRRVRRGGPRLFMVSLNRGYAAIFSRNGAPVWWYQGKNRVHDSKVLADGTVSWNTGIWRVPGPFEIRTLAGRLLRTIGDEEGTDLHDLQLLPTGNYLVGRASYRFGVDLSRFGGLPGVALPDIEIEEITPSGEVVGGWNSGDHLDLAETGRWWEEIVGVEKPLWYDTPHWNAVEADGRFMYLSFRNLDAVYKVDRDTGQVIWKLGGTETAERLEVLDYPGGAYPLGAQHDVRLQPNGTVTIFNNRSGLSVATPRAERYRINEKAGTARLIERVEDRRVASAVCCGSARRLASKEWLVSWGNSGIVGAYDDRGRTIFRLTTPGIYTYRANEVPDDSVTMNELRRAMYRMNR